MKWNSKILALIGGLGLLAFTISGMAEPPEGKGKGGNGSDNSSLRLCAEFDIDSSLGHPYITKDDTGTIYCDGTDGEILLSEGLKLSTTTRNTADRHVNVSFDGTSCDIDEDRLGDELWIDLLGEQEMDAFFGWQKTEYVEMSAGCVAGDPFSEAFGADSLECLKPNDAGEPLPIRDLTEGDTRFMSWRVNLTDVNGSLKKDGRALLMTFAGALGPHDCLVPGGLPIAIRCEQEDADGKCNKWHVKAFRACVFDYDTSKGGNWRMWGQACPINTDITFTTKP